jgi:predicted helicase
MAKELARQARELGGDRTVAALAVFGRFLVPDEEELVDRVASLPPAARAVWEEALLVPVPPGAACGGSQVLAATSRSPQPVLQEGHLLELFLRELDDSHRRRGVYYTPQPLVQFIVGRVSRLAAEHFPGRPMHVIDPACGYGAFLLHSRDHWSRGISQDAARPMVAAMQFTGIELCPITWAVAHLLLSSGPLLHNVNALTAGESLRETILGPLDRPLIPVIVGNPPWSNFGRLNRSPWLDELLTEYRAGLDERKSNLADDAIKFLRWGQYWIDQARAGILAFVTPNTWLSGLTHRRMRQSLLATFDEMLVVDLHGQAGGPPGDENVFGIRSGVAIVVMVKRLAKRLAVANDLAAHGTEYLVLSTQYDCRSVRRVDLLGSRHTKFAAVARPDDFEAESLSPTAPDFSLGRAVSHAARKPDYASYWPLNRIFRHYISGVQTKNDAVFVGYTREELEFQVRQWLAAQPEPLEFDPQFIQPYLVAPFDRRWVYYDPRLLGRPRLAVMRHMLRPNLGLVFMRQSTCPGEYDHFLAVDCLVSDRVFYSRHGAPFLAPLWLDCIAATSGRADQGSRFRVQGSGKRGQGTEDRGQDHNFDQPFVDAVQAAVGLAVSPLELFHYLYTASYSPAYRRTFADELRRGFPRMPLPQSAASFALLAKLGRALVDLHLDRVAAPAAGLLPAIGDESEFRLGGYDVLRRWQSPRKRCTWTDSDQAELERLAAIGYATRRLMLAIDESGRRDAYPTETGSSA